MTASRPDCKRLARLPGLSQSGEADWGIDALLSQRKDQVHLLDMISIGLIDESWLDRLSPTLRLRLQDLLNDPDG